MMIERINEFVARHARGVGTSARSFARIGGWTVLFLAFISILLPSREMTVAQVNGPNGKALAGADGNALPHVETFGVRRIEAKSPVQNLKLSDNDQRGFTRSPFGKQRFRIAWITGSEGGVFGPKGSEYLPSSVLAHIPEIAGRKPAVDLYFLVAMRNADIYFALLDALATKPDMIVLSLNPVFVLSPIAEHQWMQLDANAARQLLDKPASWPIAASLLSPSDLMWGLGSAALGPIRDRWYYGARIRGMFDDFGPLDRSGLLAASVAQKPDRYQAALNALPANFFLAHRAPTDSAGTPDYWAASLAVENDGQNGLNKTVLRAIGRELRDSKIPSYVYLAQVNNAFLKEAPIREGLHGIEGQLADLRPEFAAPNILYQPTSIARFVAPQQFLRHDLVHLSQPGAFGPYVARQLCRLATQVGTKAVCR
jgi:hypothetical protein